MIIPVIFGVGEGEIRRQSYVGSRGRRYYRNLSVIVISKSYFYFSPSKSNVHASFIWNFRVLCNYVRRCGQNDPIVLVFVCFPTFMSQGRGCPQFLRNWGQRSGTKILTSPKHCSATELPIFTIFLLFFCYFFCHFWKKQTTVDEQRQSMRAHGHGHLVGMTRITTVMWQSSGSHFMFSDDDAVTPKRSLQSQK